MAGDWIKMRHDLGDDPTVVYIAERLGIDPLTVVGALHKFWSWADRHLADGDAGHVSLAWLDRYIGLPSFSEMLARQGWLEPSGEGFRIPNYERHLGKNAKIRGLAQARNVTLRRRQRDAPSVTKASPEKRREEKNKDKTLRPSSVLVSTSSGAATAPADDAPEAAPPDHPDHLGEAVAICRGHDYLREILDPAATVKACTLAHPELDPLRVVKIAAAHLTAEQVAIQRQRGKGAAKFLTSFWALEARDYRQQREGPSGGGRQVGLSSAELSEAVERSQADRRQRGHV